MSVILKYTVDMEAAFESVVDKRGCEPEFAVSSRTDQSVTQQIKIGLFLRNFRIGGAERQALELAKGLDPREYRLTLFVLHDEGELKNEFQSIAELRIVILNAKTALGTLLHLVHEVRGNEIHVLHSFLYATHVYSLITKLLYARVRVIVGLRDSMADPWLDCNSRPWHLRDRAMDICLEYLSQLADAHLANSEAGKTLHLRAAKSEVIVIPNGIDTQRFHPDTRSRQALRSAIGVPANAYLVGIVANYSIHKDYPTFIRAAQALSKEVVDVHFVSIGNCSSQTGMTVKDMVRQAGLSSRFHFLGTRKDVEELIPALDVLCSSSTSEGFSNSIAEAMACGVPCVVTDVGDSRKIVGDTGVVVPPSDHRALAHGVRSLLCIENNQFQALRNAARLRIVERFSVDRMVREHQRVYRAL